MYADTKTLLTPDEAASEIWGECTPSVRKRMYRWLHNGQFDEIANRAGTPIIKDGNRYHIPMAIIAAMRGQA